MSLTHVDESGAARMVEITSKPVSRREAVASGHIKLQPATLELIRGNAIQKGDVMAVARIAGIQAAKQTSLLIPLCHQIALTSVAVDFLLVHDGITATATAKTTAHRRGSGDGGPHSRSRTALLTIYDMCKAVDKTMRLEGIHLVSKTKS